MAKSILRCSSTSLFHLKPYYKSQTLQSLHSHRAFTFAAISSYNSRVEFVGYLNIGQGLSRNKQSKRNFSIYNSVQPGIPELPPGPPSSSWISWILGIAITIVLPFLTNKWGPLLRFKDQVDEVVETVEQVSDVVEEVAEQVEKMAEDALDDLPAGKLKNMVSFVENMAERAGEKAELIGDFIDKVQEVEDNLENAFESAIDKEKKLHKETSDESNDLVKEVKADLKQH